jgi:hypothetical protein
MRASLVRVLVGASAALVGRSMGACADDSPKFGPPGGLQGKVLEIPDGTASSSGEGGLPGPCTPPGADAGADPTCPKFADIFGPLFQTAWGCGNAGCHAAGGSAPQPMVTAAVTYTLLTTYTNIKGTPYINKGCIEPEQSMIICNFAGPPNTCGTGQMPQGKVIQQADLDKLKKWISCGSPP